MKDEPSPLRVTKRISEVAAELASIGVRRGGVLLVHTSFRNVRPIEGGPRGLLTALRLALGSAGTLVMPTMTDGETPFDPRTTRTWGMGITAETFWRTEGVTRSTHPGGSFAAEGPLAAEICRPQPLSPPHGPDSPPGRVHALGGQILLLGVTHGENTTLHVAESLAGVPYSTAHPTVVVSEKGTPETVLIAETDHCCRGFVRMDGWLREAGRQREGKVGHADARLVEASDVVAIALRHLARDPLVFLCQAETDCEECGRARRSIGEGATRA